MEGLEKMGTRLGFEESELAWERNGSSIVLETKRMTILLTEDIAKKFALWILGREWR